MQKWVTNFWRKPGGSKLGNVSKHCYFQYFLVDSKGMFKHGIISVHFLNPKIGP